MSNGQQNENKERIEKALEANIPNVYFNGFVNSISSGDIITVLERNGKPAAILNMSYTLAKTLAISLGQLVSQFEEGADRNILTTHDVESVLRRGIVPEKETKQ